MRLELLNTPRQPFALELDVIPTDRAVELVESKANAFTMLFGVTPVVKINGTLACADGNTAFCEGMPVKVLGRVYRYKEQVRVACSIDGERVVVILNRSERVRWYLYWHEEPTTTRMEIIR